MSSRLQDHARKFANDLSRVCQVFNLDGKETMQNYNSIKEKQEFLFSDIENLRLKFNIMEEEKNSLLSELISSSGIDIVKFIVEHRESNKVLDYLFTTGVISDAIYEEVKGVMWKRRKRDVYHMPTSYHENYE